MASSENSQNWRKKSNSHVTERKSEREVHSRSDISENWRTGREGNSRSASEKNWRSQREENFRTKKNENWRKEEKSETRSYQEEDSVKKIHGCWKILCDINEEYEEVWKSAKELHVEQPWLFPVLPRTWTINYFKSTINVECYTPPLSDKEQIKIAAEAIRKKVFFPFVMIYVEAPLIPKKCPKYTHTPEGEFFDLEAAPWKIALIDKHSTSSYETVLPSEVTDEDYIYFPPTEEAKEKMRLPKGGKWIIYPGYNMSKQDEIWTALIPLYKEGIVVGLKGSTAMITETEQYMGGGVIHCYTADSDDINDVKKVVDKIRSVLLYNYILYYKTNSASETGRYNKEGCFSVTQYMDTVKGGFYKRDQHKRFSLVDFGN